VPTDLIGHCFNFLLTDHVAPDCTRASCCLRCHREGHQAQACKRPRSSGAVGSPLRSRCSTVVILNPRSGDVTLANQVAGPGPQHMAGDLSVPDPFGSPTPSNPSWGSTPERSPPRLTLPSPLPPPSPPPGASQRRLRFEVRMLSRTVEIDAAELVGHFCWWRPAGGLAGAGGGSSTPSLQCGYGRGLSPPLPSEFLPSLLFVMAQWWLESYTRHDHRPLISH
jgi:hypothetical protein